MYALQMARRDHPMSHRDAGAGRRYPRHRYTRQRRRPGAQGSRVYLCSQPPEKVDLGKITLPGVKDCPLARQELAAHRRLARQERQLHRSLRHL